MQSNECELMRLRGELRNEHGRCLSRIKGEAAYTVATDEQMAWQGKAGRGEAGLGEDEARHGTVGPGGARPGVARPGKARISSGLGKGCGWARRGKARPGLARRGKAWIVTTKIVRR